MVEVDHSEMIIYVGGAPPPLREEYKSEITLEKSTASWEVIGCQAGTIHMVPFGDLSRISMF